MKVCVTIGEYNFMRKFYTVILCLLVFGGVSVAQTTGTLTGVVYDKANNDPLIGANVMVVTTQLGASTDIEGKYRITGVPLGKVDIRISYISYRTKTIQGITINPGKPIVLDVYLDMEELTTEEVLVTAEAAKNSEASVLLLQKSSNNIIDGLSAEMIKKNNASDGTDVLKRMTGVTIADGKFAYIRGVSERYNNTLLNNASLPSTDPEKRSFSYDMFPAGLIEQMITSKSFTPDKPGDFSGGLVEITTIDIPNNFILNASSSASMNSKTTFNNFNTYDGGNSDWLGYDDGTRSLPSSIPDARIDRQTPDLLAITKSFKNNWTLKQSTAPVNSSFRIGLGDRFDVSDAVALGYIFSYSLSNSFETKEIIKKATYTDEGERFRYAGESGTYSVNNSTMFNLTAKFLGTQKISWKNIYNINSDDESTVYSGTYQYTLQNRKTTYLRYVSRDLFSTQLNGEHFADLLSGVVVKWTASYGSSNRNEPDLRRYVYSDDMLDEMDRPKLDLSNAYPTRFYGTLDDFARSGSVDIKINLFKNPALPNLKTGFLHDYKNRWFDARSFGFKNTRGIPDSVLFGSVNTVFNGNYFNTNKTRGLALEEDTKPTDSYTSAQKINSWYVMTEFEPVADLKVITGVRNEFSNQLMYTTDLQGNPSNVDSKYDDWLPSLSMSYSLFESFNLRGAVSRTLARPEFRELAAYTYFDFLTNELVEGNPNLKRTLINNYDLRAEWFPSPGELIAVSYFYKEFKNPIEQIYQASSGFEPIRSYANATKATTSGVEFEIRKRIPFRGYDESISPLSASTNISLIQSEIEGIGSGFQASKRPLQGQAEYIFNFGIYWDDLIDELNSSLTFNRVGERIAKVGTANLGDVIELPRNQVDFNISKTFLSTYEIKASVRDILAEDYVFVQKSPVGDQKVEVYNKGVSFSVGVSYKL